MGISVLPIIALLVIVILLGIAMAAIGLRGRLVSTNPHCRACRFDLGGLPVTGPAARCPECGKPLDAPRAVRKGMRRKRPVLLSLGIALAIIPIALVGIGIAASSRPNLHTFKPDFWLMLEARSANPGSLAPQLAELLARMQGGGLSKANTSALIVRALEVQADQSLPWDIAWGNILDFAAASGLLSEEQLRQNMRNAPVWTMVLRPTIVDGDDWILGLAMTAARAGNAPVGRVPLTLRSKIKEIRVGDRVIDLSGREQSAWMGIHPGGGSVTIGRHRVNGIEPGKHTVEIEWDLGVAPSHDQPSHIAWTETRTATIEILPAGTTGITVVEDPTIRQAVLKSLSLSKGIAVVRSGDPTRPTHLGFGIECANPPMSLAFDLILRERLGEGAAPDATPREWKIGTVAFSGGGTHHYGGGSDVQGFDAAAVDLVLRPSIDAAQGTLNIYKIWDGEVVFRDVPLVGAKAGAPIDPRAGPRVLPDAQSP